MNMHVDESWPGWTDARKIIRRGKTTAREGLNQFGLEMQCPYAEHLLTGRKTIETRAYVLPSPLLTIINDETSDEIRIDILESKSGKDGVSSIPDLVEVTSKQDHQSSQPLLIRKGWCTFIKSFKYETREQFEADEHKHLVPPTSGYGWNDDKQIYGWVVGTCGRYPDANSDEGTCYAQRRMRSLFEIQKK